jgi:large subunit ribosomal protein L18
VRTKREKKSSRLRAKLRIKHKIKGTDERPRISVFKSGKYTYAQIISDDSQSTLVSAASNQEEVVKAISKIEIEEGKTAKSPKSVIAAKALGIVLAERAKAKNIASVVFDRNGYTYTGRIQALAEGARQGGLEF